MNIAAIKAQARVIYDEIKDEEGITCSIWRRPTPESPLVLSQGAHTQRQTGIPASISATGRLMLQSKPFMASYAQTGEVGMQNGRLITMPLSWAGSAVDVLEGDVLTDDADETNGTQYSVNDVARGDIALYINTSMLEAGQLTLTVEEEEEP